MINERRGPQNPTFPNRRVSKQPIMIRWFKKAATCKIGFEAKINKMKLSVVYDFIKEFPMLYIELSNQ